MIFPYIINVALVLGACVAFYKVLLRKETLFKVNRYVLMVCLVISFALPLLQIPQEVSLRKASPIVSRQLSVLSAQQVESRQSPNVAQQTSTSKSQQVTSAKQPITNNQQLTTSEFSAVKVFQWLFWTYWFGVILCGASFLFQVVLLIYRAYRRPAIVDGGYRIVEMSGDHPPCSFGNTIFINSEKYDRETYNQILLHEKIHVHQKHTVDILIAEIVLIFQWFNPFAWIYRREIENNLEFLTDDQLMQKKQVDRKTYQLSLVKVAAPYYPLNLTNNYNQSILKKRIAMMNSKRSNLHTAWKYFFLVPVLAFLACLLNEPFATAQLTKPKTTAKQPAIKKEVHNHDLRTEGYWFATIKDDKVNIRFSDEKLDNEDDKSEHSFSGSDFKLSELGTLPRGTSGTFSLSREAGRMDFTGKFDGNSGMGTYKFNADKSYIDYMNKELKDKLDDEDQVTFFLVNIKKDFVSMLKNQGYSNISKDDLIPVAALGIDQAYISSIKNAGFKDVSLENLVSLKALGIDDKYISEIRSAGYKNITTDQLVSFKAQEIDKDYIAKVRQLKGSDIKDGDDDADDIVSFKAMDITEEYINSLKAAGLTNIPNDELVSMKAVGVTPEYIKGWYALGFKDIRAEDFVGMKSQNVTPEFMKSFTDMGYKDIEPENLVAFKALGITPEWVRSFEAAGYRNIDAEQLPALKSQNITPQFIKSFEPLGFKNIDIEEIVSVRAVGVTPDYIKQMRSKGFNYNSLEKYVTLKSLQ